MTAIRYAGKQRQKAVEQTGLEGRMHRLGLARPAHHLGTNLLGAFENIAQNPPGEDQQECEGRQSRDAQSHRHHHLRMR